MKLAFLICVHENTSHFQRLLRNLISKSHDIYVHVDAKVDITPFLKNENKRVFFIHNRVPVYWGGFSQVKATLQLIYSASLKKRYDYYVLLSGSDYPIRSNQYIDTFFQKGKGSEYINICEMPQNGKSLSRIQNIYFEEAGSLMNTLAKVLPYKRRLPEKFRDFTLYGGSTWWALSHEAILYLKKFIRENPDFYEFYERTLCPDEMFFHTILGNSRFYERMTPSITYSKFPKGGAHPEPIRMKHIAIFFSEKIETVYGTTKALFARKFDKNSKKAVEAIDTLFRTNRFI